MTSCYLYLMTLRAYLDLYNDHWTSLAIGAHRLMLSRGVYDDVFLNLNSLIKYRIGELTITLMARSFEIFNLFHTQVLPDKGDPFSHPW